MFQSISRKSYLLLAALMLPLSGNALAEADPKIWPVIKEAFFSNRPIEEASFIQLTAPKRAESGAQVPFSIALDNSQGDAKAIKKIYVIVDANPIQLAATYNLTEALGKFNLSTRIRLKPIPLSAQWAKPLTASSTWPRFLSAQQAVAVALSMRMKLKFAQLQARSR